MTKKTTVTDSDIEAYCKKLAKLRRKFKRAFDNETALLLTKSDVAILNITILSD